MFNTIEEVTAHVDHLKNAPPYEINEHLATFQRLGAECETICEFGVGVGTSTWAFLSTQPKWMRSYDIIKYNEVDGIIETAKNMNWDWQLIIQNTVAEGFVIDECDLLFIDSLHNGWHVKTELDNNAHRVKKYIVFHDTEKYGELGQDGIELDLHPDVPGITGAINEFLSQHPEWQVKERYTNCNGLLVIGR
jgi:hypothetical protein